MDKTDQQRLELLRKISANNRSASNSRVKTPSNNNANAQVNKSASSTSSAQPGCNVCSRKKRS